MNKLQFLILMFVVLLQICVMRHSVIPENFEAIFSIFKFVAVGFFSEN